MAKGKPTAGGRRRPHGGDRTAARREHGWREPRQRSMTEAFVGLSQLGVLKSHDPPVRQTAGR